MRALFPDISPQWGTSRRDSGSLDLRDLGRR
jgi:hypothetical protein